jgi:hypothetical protein
MARQIVWHGTYEESVELIHAISRNCACNMGEGGVRLETCAAHQMLTDSQRSLDGLLFVRRMADRLRREEFSGQLTPTSW